MLFDVLSARGHRISETEVIKRIAKSVVVLFETRDGPYYFEITGSRNISEFLNLVDDLTVPDCETRTQLGGNRIALYSFYLGQSKIKAQSDPGIGGNRKFKTDSNLLKSQDEKREKLFNFLIAKGNPISETLATDRLEAFDEWNSYTCRSWKK